MLALGNLFSRSRQYNRCTWGNEVVLDENGNMFPCLYVIGDENYLLGNISEKKHAQDILKPILVNQIKDIWKKNKMLKITKGRKDNYILNSRTYIALFIGENK